MDFTSTISPNTTIPLSTLQTVPLQLKSTSNYKSYKGTVFTTQYRIILWMVVIGMTFTVTYFTTTGRYRHWKSYLGKNNEEEKTVELKKSDVDELKDLLDSAKNDSIIFLSMISLSVMNVWIADWLLFRIPRHYYS